MIYILYIFTNVEVILNILNIHKTYSNYMMSK